MTTSKIELKTPRPDVRGRVGTTGYCMGGRASVRAPGRAAS